MSRKSNHGKSVLRATLLSKVKKIRKLDKNFDRKTLLHFAKNHPDFLQIGGFRVTKNQEEFLRSHDLGQCHICLDVKLEIGLLPQSKDKKTTCKLCNHIMHNPGMIAELEGYNKESKGKKSAKREKRERKAIEEQNQFVSYPLNEIEYRWDTFN